MLKAEREAVTLKGFREGYRLGLYAGAKLAKLGVRVAEPGEAKQEEVK